MIKLKLKKKRWCRSLYCLDGCPPALNHRSSTPLYTTLLSRTANSCRNHCCSTPTSAQGHLAPASLRFGWLFLVPFYEGPCTPGAVGWDLLSPEVSGCSACSWTHWPRQDGSTAFRRTEGRWCWPHCPHLWQLHPPYWRLCPPPALGARVLPLGLSYPTAFFLLTFHMKVYLFHDLPSPLVSQTKPVEMKPEDRGVDVEYASTLMVQGPHTLSQHSHLFLSYPCPAHTQFPATQCASSASLSPHVCVYSLPWMTFPHLEKLPFFFFLKLIS